MDKNTIIGLVAIFAIMVGWSYFMQPSEAELAAQQRQRDSIVAIEKVQDSLTQTAAAAVAVDSMQKATVAKSNGTSVTDTAIAKVEAARYGVFAGAASADQKYYTFENNLIKLTISNKGGRITSVLLKEFKTYDQKALVLFDEVNSKFDVSFFAGNHSINTGELYFTGSTANQDSVVVGEKDSVTFSLRLPVDGSNGTKYIEYLYALKHNSYALDFQIRTVGMQDVFSAGTENLHVDWQCRLNRQEKSVKGERNVTSIYYKPNADDVDYLSETKDDEEKLGTSLKWIGFKQQFFTSVFISKNTFASADIKTKVEEKSDAHLKTMYAGVEVPLDNTNVIPLQFYFGPTKYKILKGMNLELERQIPLGWGFFVMAWINRFAVIPVFNFLESFNLNYGIIILILTILLKIVLFPIAYKTYLSSAKMRILKPETDEINAKFPKSEDALKKQQSLMTLYKKAGVNPMAGCVPMLLQFPILIAMFRFFPASIELRQEAFLWANDLSSYDSVWNLGFTIPFYGDHVSLWTLLMTISTIIYTRLNMDMMPQNNQIPGMKTMMYLMPIMFLGIFNDFACGLSYYYFLANVITFAQMYFIRLMVNEDKLHAQIQLNKAKPIKKSKFQTKLEEMAKQRGAGQYGRK